MFFHCSASSWSRAGCCAVAGAAAVARARAAPRASANVRACATEKARTTGTASARAKGRMRGSVIFRVSGLRYSGPPWSRRQIAQESGRTPVGGARSPSELSAGSRAEDRGEDVLVVPDHKGGADPHRRRTKLAPAADHQLHQLFIGRAIRGRKVHLHDCLPLRDPKLGHSLEQRERLGCVDGLFGRATRLRGLDSVLRKKLLRAFAARSAGAVVSPVEARGHSGQVLWGWMAARPAVGVRRPTSR